MSNCVFTPPSPVPACTDCPFLSPECADVFPYDLTAAEVNYSLEQHIPSGPCAPEI